MIVFRRKRDMGHCRALKRDKVALLSMGIAVFFGGSTSFVFLLNKILHNMSFDIGGVGEKL